MKTTVFTDTHIKLGAKMEPFAGYNMPVQYEGIIAEHNNVRQKVGVFDVSHMGEFWIKGPKAFALLQREAEHGPDALAGAAGGVEGGLCSKQGGGVLLALGDDAARLIEAVGSRNFGDVPPFAAQRTFALVAGHVQAGGAALFIGGDEVADGGLHPSSPRAIWSMMAHSMRFLNSSQPCLYTPPMLPVAW